MTYVCDAKDCGEDVTDVVERAAAGSGVVNGPIRPLDAVEERYIVVVCSQGHESTFAVPA